jgi:hypothetical protein
MPAKLVFLWGAISSIGHGVVDIGHSAVTGIEKGKKVNEVVNWAYGQLPVCNTTKPTAQFTTKSSYQPSWPPVRVFSYPLCQRGPFGEVQWVSDKSRFP